MVQLFITKNWKIFTIAALVALVWLLFQWGNSQRIRANESEKATEAAILDYRNATKKYINAQGDVVEITKAFELSKIEFKKATESNDINWIKKFKDYKRTQTAESFTTEFAPEDKIIVRTIYLPCKDSVKAFRYSFKDDWNNIEATVLDTPNIKIRDRYFAVITKARPKNWFWKLQWSKWNFSGQVTNSNKLIKVDSLQTIVVR